MRSMLRALAALSLMSVSTVELQKQREQAMWGMLSSRRTRPASLRGCNRGTGLGVLIAETRETAKAEAVKAQYAHLPPASAYPL